jgi:glycosyltransferase involved in cell wall biosynthesis
MNIDIVIPCYNENKNLEEILKKIYSFKKFKYLKFIVVDNGSIDNSFKNKKVIKFLRSNNIKLVIIKKNKGYGNGILNGLNHAKSSYVGWTHADANNFKEQVFKIIQIIRNNNQSNLFIKGIRKGGRPSLEIFFSICLSLVSSIMLQKPFFEITAQPTIFDKSLLKNFYNPPIDFSLDLYAYYIAKKYNYNFRRINLKFNLRKYGASSWNKNFFSKIYLSVNYLKFIIELFFKRR